jgi:hypothetical protein
MPPLKFTFIAPLLAATLSAAETTQVIPLWPDGAPGFEARRNEPEQGEGSIRNIHNPSVTVFLPPKANGAAVLIFPGGGFRQVVFNSEGIEPARYLNNLGVAAFVRLQPGRPLKTHLHQKLAATNGRLAGGQRVSGSTLKDRRPNCLCFLWRPLDQPRI